MSQDTELAENLKKQMTEYVEKGYARKLMSNEMTENARVWYLPVFTIKNPNKPKKIRMVWDAAAKVDGVSLNSMLLKGPDQLSSLPNILYRFREKNVAICGDIREMFHQVLINKKDQNCQRFLWRDGIQNCDPDIYVMQVMTFGATCSPSSAQYVKNINADKYTEEFPRASNAIKCNHYVDDWLDSTDTELEAIQLSKEVRHIHSKGGFEIRNWLSNSKTFLCEMGESSDQNMKNIINFEAQAAKVLGMWWCTKTDTFSYSVNRNRLNMKVLDGTHRPTKREVLRTLMTIFDPLGLIAFFLVYVKILLQEIWRSSLDWDDEINDAQYEKWKIWTKYLWAIKKVQIQRCYSLSNPISQQSIQLHIFVDASENAYAAVAYLRIEYKDHVECVLVSSKTKVAPQKPMSIPRLELQASVLGARLMNSIGDAHSLNFTKRYLWSDSKTVLCWLRSDARKYSQFVALRIGELLETTEIREWHWVPTEHNVADEATKWNDAPKICSNSRWFKGPEFLLNSEEFWPKDITPFNPEQDEEVREHFIHSKISILPPTTPNIMSFSCWNRLVASQAYVIRAVHNFTPKRHPRKTGPLSVEERTDARNMLYRKAQWDLYKDEISILSKIPSDKLEKSSNIYKLSPYLDHSNVLRIRGRIDAAEGVLPDTKRPVILPRNHPITKLIISFYHKKFHHRNHESW